MSLRRNLLAFAAILLPFCAVAAPREAASSRPVFRPEVYFAGRTSSQGALETIASSRRVAVVGFGRRAPDGTFVLTQDISFSDGERERRVWRFRSLGSGRYDGTADDVVGVAQGEAQGSVFHLRYTLARVAGNPLADVDVEHEMVLQPDGRTLVNRAEYSKFAIPLGTLTERFTRGPVHASSRSRQ